MQPDLFPPIGLSITPEAGRKEPRLWVRKLVIWEKPERILREVDLRPGLNIVWSPDPGADDTLPIGHGSGKTTFCRFMRYCLGEENFAPDGQRNAIIGQFPEGHVGAEVMLDGELWIVLRLLSHRRRDVVIKNGTFAEAFIRKDPTGIEPLRNAIMRTIVGDVARLMPQSVGSDNAWDAALAWLTRDQECRFSHHLEWRDSESNSHSPVRGRSRDDHLTIVRAFLQALKPEEITEAKKEEVIDKALSDANTLWGRLEWQIRESKNLLFLALGGGSDAGADLDDVRFRALAAENHERILKLPIGGSVDLVKVRGDRDKAQSEVDRLQKEGEQNDIRLENAVEIDRLLDSELPVDWANWTKEEKPICPTCQRPLDIDHAAHIGVSKGVQTRDQLRAKFQSKSEQLKAIRNQQTELRTKVQQIKYDLAVAKQKLAPLEARLTILEKAISDRTAAIRQSERLMDEVERYSAFLKARATVAKAIDENTTNLEAIKDTMKAHREDEFLTIAQLSGHFQTVVRQLSHTDASAGIKLDGKGLSLRTDLGGAAIDSLKVVAFDYAVLMQTMEGKTRLPGFLLHDSPREADLGRSIYNRLFDFIKELEAVGEAPLFQYVVTTTTEPPEAFQSEPWLCLKILGSPAENRLMKANL